MANEFVQIVHDDRVKDTISIAPGTGSTLTLAGLPPQGFITIDDADSILANNDYCYYCVIDSADWEIGFGIIDTSGRTVGRDKILRSSNGDAIVNFTGTGGTFITVHPATVLTEFQEYVLSGATVSNGSDDLEIHGVTDFMIREPLSDTAYALVCQLVGRQTGGAVGTVGDMVYINRVLMYDNNGGTVAEQYDTADLHEVDGGIGTGASLAGSIDASNNRIKLSVTGVTDRNISWTCHVKVIRV